MKKTLLLTTIAFLLLQICNGQADTAKNAVYNAEFKWNITIPKSFNSLSAEDYAKLQQKGADAMEKTTNSKIENHSKPIFAFKADQLHYFESNSQPFDPATEGDFVATCKGVDKIVYQTFEQQMPANTKMDSTYSTETIDKLEFQRFEIKVTLPNGLILNMFMYNRLFGNEKELTVTILYADKDKGNLILNAWRNSKFDAN